MSKEKLLLVGAGGFGRMVAEQAMIQYDCAFVDDGQSVGTEICGIPVIGSLADLPELQKSTACWWLVSATIRSGRRCIRRQSLLAMRSRTSVAPSAYISPYAKLGCGCVTAKRLYPEWSLCRKRCSAECRNGSPL